MMPLTNDWTALNAKIDAMTPTGNTNVTIGLAWGLQTLSPNAPFNAPRRAPDLDKVIILLTDGENTQNRWTSSSSSIDARTEKVCDNIKAANIKLYTVRVIDGNATLLKNCATKPDMYYDVRRGRSSSTACSARSRRTSPICASPSSAGPEPAWLSTDGAWLPIANEPASFLQLHLNDYLRRQARFRARYPGSLGFAVVSAIDFTLFSHRVVYDCGPK